MVRLWNRVAHLVCIGFLLVSCPLHAADENWGTPYDDLFQEHRADVEVTKEDDGSVVRSVVLPGKVWISQRRRGAKVTTTAIDQSGRGGVLCAAGIYTAIQMVLDSCSDIDHPKGSQRLAVAMERVNKFIVENSVPLTTLERLRAKQRERVEAFEAQVRGDSPRSEPLQCLQKGISIRGFEPMLDAFAVQSDAEFHKWLDTLLGEPRLPVMNPCL